MRRWVKIRSGETSRLSCWTKLNEAKEILRGLLNVSSSDSLPVWIKPKGEAQRFLGEREAWLSYPLIIKFPTEVPQGTYDPEAG